MFERQTLERFADDMFLSRNQYFSRVTESEEVFVRQRSMCGCFVVSDLEIITLGGGSGSYLKDFLQSFLGEIFSHCVVVAKDRDISTRCYIYHAYSMWFEPLKGYRVVPTYEWFIGSRNGALICMMVDKQEIASWLKSKARRCEGGLCLPEPCAICGKKIHRGDFYFSRGEQHGLIGVAHMDCVLSEDVIQELEIERGERDPEETDE